MKVSTRVIGAAAAAGLVLGAISGQAAAEDRQFGYTWTITGASDYLFRGYSFTGNDPTVNSYLEMTYGIAYLGFWTSNIDTGDKGLGPWEQDVYLGIRPVTGPLNWDIGVLYYLYGNKANEVDEATDGLLSSIWDTDYFEFKIAVTTSPIKNLTLGVTGYWTPDQDYAIPESETIEGSAAYTLPQVGIFTPTISGQVGYWNFESNSIYPNGYLATNTGVTDGYLYWNAGVKLAVEKFTFDLRYYDTELDSDLADERFFFSAAVTLP